MKKKVIFMVVAVMAMSLAACSSEEASQSMSADTKQVESEETSGTDYANMVPVPEEFFINGDISTVSDGKNGNMYLVQVRNFEDGEYETYISKCKEMGFTDVKYETENDGGKMFGAYTEDGDCWVEVLLGNNNGILAITCKESTKK